MNSKERVQTALNHQQPDRPPLDLGGAFTTTINVVAYDRLRWTLGLPAKDSLLREQTQSVIVDEDVRRALGVDVIGLYERPPIPEREQPDEDGNLVSEWGIIYRQSEGSARGAAYTMVTHPLAEATLADLETYPWPDPDDPGRYLDLAEKVKHLYETTDYALVAGAIGMGLFEQAQCLRGIQQFFEDLLINQDFASRLIDKILQIQLRIFDRYLAVVGPYVEMVETSDDYGMQTGPLISPGLYREMLQPAHKRLNRFIKERTEAKIFLHSCGSIAAVLDDLIDAGVDVINPVQPRARDMDSTMLKSRFGDRVVFHGGVD